MHTRQLQQYTQDNYNNTHKTTTTIHTRQLQQYTQDNHNNTHKTTTTIHTANQQQLHTRQLKTTNNTCETNYNTTCTEGKNTQICLTNSFCDLKLYRKVTANHFSLNFTQVEHSVWVSLLDTGLVAASHHIGPPGGVHLPLCSPFGAPQSAKPCYKWRGGGGRVFAVDGLACELFGVSWCVFDLYQHTRGHVRIPTVGYSFEK